MHAEFWLEDLKGREHVEVLVVDGMWEVLDWIHLAQDRDK
jgi:hypothetical protein